MKRLILFSRPGETVKQKIVPLLFPNEIGQKVFAFLPSEGLRGSEKYIAIFGTRMGIERHTKSSSDPLKTYLAHRRRGRT